MKTLLNAYKGFLDDIEYTIQDYFDQMEALLRGRTVTPQTRNIKARITFLRRLYEATGELKCAICGAPVLHARAMKTPQGTRTFALFGKVKDGKVYTNFNIDHIVPVAITQDLGPANLQLTCLCCNFAKGKDYTAADVDQVLSNLRTQEKLYRVLRDQKEPRDKEGLKSLIFNSLK